jgi:hypothetical protein
MTTDARRRVDWTMVSIEICGLMDDLALVPATDEGRVKLPYAVLCDHSAFVQCDKAVRTLSINLCGHDPRAVSGSSQSPALQPF